MNTSRNNCKTFGQRQCTYYCSELPTTKPALVNLTRKGIYSKSVWKPTLIEEWKAGFKQEQKGVEFSQTSPGNLLRTAVLPSWTLIAAGLTTSGHLPPVTWLTSTPLDSSPQPPSLKKILWMSNSFKVPHPRQKHLVGYAWSWAWHCEHIKYVWMLGNKKRWLSSMICSSRNPCIFRCFYL